MQCRVLQDGLSLPFSHANSTTENARRAGQSNLSVPLKAFPSLKSHGTSITFTFLRQCDYLFSDCEIQRSDNYILHIWVTQKEQECLYTSHRGWGYFGILKCTHIVSSWCFLVDWQTKFIKGITLILFSFSIWTFWLLFKLNAWAFVIFPSNFTSFWLLLKVLEWSTGWGRPPLPHWYQEELRWCCLQP